MKAILSSDFDQIEASNQSVVAVETNESSDAIASSEELVVEMTRTMTSNECSNSEDVCHSIQSDCDQSAPTENNGFEFRCDAINNEISSTGISSSSGNKEVVTPDDAYCEVIVTANALDALAVSSNSVEPDLNADLNGDSSGDNNVTCSTSAVVNHNSQSNDCTNVLSNSGLNKKKFGKFRFLNDEQNRATDNACEPPMTHSEETSLDSSKFDEKAVTNESSSHDNSENSDSSKTEASPLKSNLLNKRRGRPAGSTKKEKIINYITPQTSLEEEDLSRRRSSRLKTLEARKEQERAVFAQQRDLDDSSQESNTVLTSDANDSVAESAKESKHKKKKSKKDKNKSKDKSKNSDSKKKRRKKKCVDDHNKHNCDHQNDHFATPLPPSHYSNIKSNSLSNSSNRNTIEDETSPKPEKVKSRWRRNSELEYGHGFNGDKQSAQTVPIIIPKETEPPPPFDALDENVYLFERFV